MQELLAQRLGEKVRLLRTVKGLSQENMAQQLGMSQSNFARIERGEIDVPLSRIDELAKAFGITSSELLDVSSSNYFYQCTNGVGTNHFNAPVNFTESQAAITAIHETVQTLQVLVEKLTQKLG